MTKTTTLLKLLILVLVTFSCNKDDEPIIQPPKNNAPEISAQSFNVSEAVSDIDILGTVKATDPDGDTLSFSITTDSDDLFEITTAGAISLAAGKLLDFEGKTLHEITVEVTDENLKSSAKVTINVTNIDDNKQPIIVAQTFDVSEDRGGANVLATVVATDPEGDNLNYSLINPTGAKVQFSITDNHIKLSQGESLDFESKTSHVVTVTVDDGSLTASADITINVVNVNEAPVLRDFNSFPVPDIRENIADTAVFTTVTATDPEGDNLTFSLTSNPDQLFEITTNGDLSLAPGKKLDYETATSHRITIQVSDGNLTHSRNATVNVMDVWDPAIGDYFQDGVIFWIDPTDNTNVKMCYVKDSSVRLTQTNASNYCYNLVVGDQMDWYLPSDTELIEMYQNKSKINSTALANGGTAFDESDWYWSSTRVSLYSTSWWLVRFSVGGKAQNYHGANYAVRAIRAFQYMP
ncbi:cadherin domain-containing protein [Aquimarina sediminis]|uniref:cadherin domain-containing protein n=1 Tax=Aquimarina sediminis TaxID=2070536 RepID=UPI000CA07849|nr:cadherin domain-containing protein [Aquimarina sediminis]